MTATTARPFAEPRHWHRLGLAPGAPLAVAVAAYDALAPLYDPRIAPEGNATLDRQNALDEALAVLWDALTWGAGAG